MNTHSNALNVAVEAFVRESGSLVAVAARSMRYASADLTLLEYRALIILATRGPQPLGALTAHLGTPAAPMFSRLVERGLAVNVPSANAPRRRLVTLSTAGRALMHDISERRRLAIADVLRNVPATAMPTLVGGFHDLAVACDELVPLTTSSRPSSLSTACS